MLSSNNGMLLAEIKSLKKRCDNGKVFFYDKDSKCCKNCSPKCNLKTGVCCESCYQFLYKKGDDEENIYNNNKEIILNDDKYFQCMPSNLPNTQRSVVYVSGPNGCGKSVYISNWLIEFRKMYKNYKVYLISRKTSDDVLDHLIDKRLNPDELIDAELKAEDFKFDKETGQGSCIVFDDCDTLSADKKKNVRKAVYDLMEDCIEVGRSYGIFLVVSSHIGANQKESKRILNGCTSLTLFTSCLNVNNIYLLEKHIGLNKDHIKRIKNLKSRWMTIQRNTHPHVLISEKELFLIKY
jgi:hypothetical protein